MSIALNRPLVDTGWLAQRLGQPGLLLLDATWHHPSTGQNGRADYEAGHLPGAVYFDIDAITDKTTPLPHMLPETEQFQAQAGALGLGPDISVVVYDRSGGGAAAARVWWTLRVFGHPTVALLDGGFKKWAAEGRPLETGTTVPVARTVAASYDPALVRGLDQMQSIIASGEEQILDARSDLRFRGEAPEPWPHRKVGHMKGARNLPWDQLLEPDGTILPKEELARRFAAAGLDLDRPVVASCGSGVTASMLAFGLFLAGKTDVAVYDGSWAEWGMAEDTEALSGPA